MKTYSIALFGEAEKGKFHTAYFLEDLAQLMECLGHPPTESRGLFYAVQALMFDHPLIFFRVEEEGYSCQDYFAGLLLLEKQNLITHVAAIFLPGVGDAEIIGAAAPLCRISHSILITTEPDLYDYLSERKRTGTDN